MGKRNVEGFKANAKLGQRAESKEKKAADKVDRQSDFLDFPASAELENVNCTIKMFFVFEFFYLYLLKLI